MADNYGYYIKRQDQAPKISCECGCGELIPSITRRGYPARFKNGHGQRGENHSQWKGGRYKDKNGYWLIWKPDHPKCYENGYVPEHRLVYEQYYNCCLLPWVEIHYKISVKEGGTNDISNLMVVFRSEYIWIEKYIDMSDRVCEICGSSETDKKTSGRPHWHKAGEQLACNKCYMKWYDKNKRVRK